MKIKYIDGLREIQADNELKKDIDYNIQSKTPRRNLRLLKPLVLVSAVCAFLLITGSEIENNTENSDVAAVFDSGLAAVSEGFLITAFAEDGAPINVTPNVEFPLGKYQMTMSHVPGLPIRIVNEEADVIKLNAASGNLLSWAPPDSRVISQGLGTQVKSGETIYWSPLPEITNQSTIKLEIAAYKNKKEIGRGTIEIEADSDFNYTGKLTSLTN